MAIQKHPKSCNQESCPNAARFLAVVVSDRRCNKEYHLCKSHFDTFEQYQRKASSLRSPIHRESRLDIELIVFDQERIDGDLRLRVVDTQCSLVITMGVFELTSLYHTMKMTKTRRPLTFETMANTIAALDARLQDVIIDDFIESEQIYYAKLRIEKAGEHLLLDVRPSDAINLAVACNTPILISQSILSSDVGPGGPADS